MNEADISFFKTFLLTQKSSILNKTSEFKNEQSLLVKGPISEDYEAASADQTLQVNLHLQERNRSMLMQIEKALSKLEDGTYGRCESCEEMIEVRRLKARPFATLCITCKEDEEDPRHYLN